MNLYNKLLTRPGGAPTRALRRRTSESPAVLAVQNGVIGVISLSLSLSLYVYIYIHVLLLSIYVYICMYTHM